MQITMEIFENKVKHSKNVGFLHAKCRFFARKETKNVGFLHATPILSAKAVY